jgi:S1-C subfamily serine protease
MFQFLKKQAFWKPALPFLWLIALSLVLIFRQYTFENADPPQEVLPVSFGEVRTYDDALALQQAFIRNAKYIKPMVVSVNRVEEVVQEEVASSSDGESPLLRKGKQIWNKMFAERHYLVENVGSGVLLGDEGYVLTNYHVVDNLDRILIKLSSNREYFAKVVGSDRSTDLTVLKISTLKKLPQPRFGKSGSVAVGEWVMAVVIPYGLEGTVTVGVVSGMGRDNLGIATFENFIQTDASINPGNSGGPLINLNGEIIGINTAVAAIGSGVGFAIPIEMALRISEQLIEKGTVDRGWLGIGIQTVTPELAASFNAVNWKGGVLVNSVEGHTPADSAGLRRGDIIIQYDGQRVPGSKKFQSLVANTEVGRTVPIKVLRDGAEKILHAKIGKSAS